MNREQIESLTVGNKLRFTMDTAHGKPLPGARYSDAREVVEITYRGTSDKGRVYVGGYTEFGENSRISFSIAEGEESYRLEPQPEPPTVRKTDESFIEALGGRVRLAVTDASHIHVDANHNCLTGGPTACGPLTVRGVQYGASAHFYLWSDGAWHIGREGDDSYRQRDSLYLSRLNAKSYSASFPSESARRKVAETLTPLVNAWAAQHPEVFQAAERERLERERAQAEADVQKAEAALREAQGRLAAL